MDLIQKCKQAIRDNDLESASKYWQKIFEVYAPDLKEDEEIREQKAAKLFELMGNFTDAEVYKVTDYLKSKEE